MERRRKYNRRGLQTINTLLPPVLLVAKLSTLLVFCSFFVLVDYAECIMTLRDESGVYSLFPDEDLQTGRKRLRFDEETTIRNYRDGREYSSSVVRSYPMLPHDRLHRPVDFSGGSGREGSRQVFDDFRDRNRDRDRERHGRIYFDDNFRSSRFDYHRLTPRPRPIDRPVNPIIFETSRGPPPSPFYLHDSFPPGPPAVGQSKLPPGASSRTSGEDIPTRVHVFNPDSTNFGNPRSAGGGEGGNDGRSSSERTRGPPSNFVETGPPGPESFLNHEEFLEYQKKIAFARFHEQDVGGNGGGGGGGKKVLFESKEPFEIDGLIPPNKSGEISGKLPTTSKVPIQSTVKSSFSPPITQQQRHHERHQILLQQQTDQRQHQLQQEGQKVRTTGATQQQQHRHSTHPVEEVDEERDTGGGEVESDIVNGKGEEVESENGKSEVTQLPPTHITKSGRTHHRQHVASEGNGFSVSASDHSGGGNRNGNKKFTPSISHNEEGGEGTGFKLPTTVVSYSDEPPNLNGFVPVVPFHLIGAEQPRAISLERPRQQQQHRIVPHHDHNQPPVHSTTASTTTSTTIRSIPVTTTIATTTARSKGEKSGFRPTTEVSKSFTAPSPFSIVSSGAPDNTGNNNDSGDGIPITNSGFVSSPASPILHATAGERSNSETHTKVAITKQQELKRLHKQRQYSSPMHQQITPPPHSAGLFPDIGFGDSSASSDSADNSDNPGIFTNTYNDFLDEMMVTTHHSPPQDKSSSPTPTLTQHPVDTKQYTDPSTTMYPSSTPSSSSEQTFSNSNDIVDSSEQKTQTIPENQSQFLPTAHLDSLNSLNADSSNNANINDTLDEIVKHSPPPPQQKVNTEQEHSTETLGDDETVIKSVADSENILNNGLYDKTRAVKIANGIKQGEFLLEGYMINSNNNDNEDGDGSPPFSPPSGGSKSSLSSRSSASADADYINNNINNNNINEENAGNNELPYHRHLYDYPDRHDDNQPMLEVDIVGTSSPIIPPNDDDGHHHDDNTPLSPVIPELPGTTTPNLEQTLSTPSSETPSDPVPYLNPKNLPLTGGSSSSTDSNSAADDASNSSSQQHNGEDVTGNEEFSRSGEPESVKENEHGQNSGNSLLHDGGAVVLDEKVVESKPTPPPELHRPRLSEINEQSNFAAVAAPTNQFYVNDEIDNSTAFFPYYDTYGNKINATHDRSQTSSSSSGSASSSKNGDDDDDMFSVSGSGEGAYQYRDEDGAFENDVFNRGDTTIQKDKSSSSSLSSSHAVDASVSNDKHIRKSNSQIFKLRIMDAHGNFLDGNKNPSSISIPVEATLKYSKNGLDISGEHNFNGGGITKTGGGNSASVGANSIYDNVINDDVSDSFGSGKTLGAVEDYDQQSNSLLNRSNDNSPLYLESSETLLNKTYYLDGNYNSIHMTSTKSSSSDGQNYSNSIKSSNFIKVTRIKTSSGPSSQETAEKTASTILARRTSKPAVIVSTSSGGARPRVVGSVVEAGPAWPGLVSNFLRTNNQLYNNNRSFTATATVRPRGNSGTNPSPPTTVITGQVQQITHEQVQKQQQQQQIPTHRHRQQSPHTPPPSPQQLQQDPPPTIRSTEFQLQQIRTPTVTTIGSSTKISSSNSNPSKSTNNNESKNRNIANHHNHPSPSTNAHYNHHNANNNNSSSSAIFRNGGTNVNTTLTKQTNSKPNANSSNQQQQPNNNHNNHSGNNTDSSKAHSLARRLYSSEEDSSSAQIRSNSSTGIVSLVHAHISHCPKLHSPTEVICDVHIRQGHGVPNPQLTVGWRRKYYNSTQPDVLLALNKAPASGEHGIFDPHHSVMEVDLGKGERLEEFHDKFNVTLAPGISPMLRSVLLIRSVTAPDCGTYQCEVNDGINVLKSETLLFLCH